jgi:hypothetical protein
MAERLYIPEPKYSRLKRTAEAQGMTPPAFVIRLFTLYESNPAAYEKLFIDVLRAKQAAAQSPERHSRT